MHPNELELFKTQIPNRLNPSFILCISLTFNAIPIYPIVVSSCFLWLMHACESWTIKTAELRAEELMLWTVKLGKTLERPLGCKIKPVNLKGNQPWIFIGRTDAEAGASILRPPDVNSWLTGKDPDAGKNWRQKENGAVDNEMVREHHHQLNGHEFEQTPGNSEGQRSLAYCSSCGCKKWDMTWQLNNSNK